MNNRQFWATVAISLWVCLPLHAQAVNPTEQSLFEKAQISGLPADYQAYLAAYPSGAFADAARFELQWATPDDTASATAAVEPAPVEPAPAVSPPVAAPQTGISFTTPLISETPEVQGKSIADLIKGSPLFAPIEGIPDSMWKGQTCSNCHSWTQEALCAQGQTYSTEVGAHALTKKHPYGGAFKAAIKTFAIEGCK